MILDLIEGRRMWWGFAFELLDEYFRFLEGLVPGTVRHPEFFRHYGETARRTWLGALALSAATDAEWLVPVVDDLRRTKTMNQPIHVRFAMDPDRWVRELREAAEHLKTTEDDPLADLESMTTEQMRSEIAIEQRCRTTRQCSHAEAQSGPCGDRCRIRGLRNWCLVTEHLPALL